MLARTTKLAQNLSHGADDAGAIRAAASRDWARSPLGAAPRLVHGRIALSSSNDPPHASSDWDPTSQASAAASRPNHGRAARAFKNFCRTLPATCMKEQIL